MEKKVKPNGKGHLLFKGEILAWQFDQHFFNTFQHLSHKSCFFGSSKIHCFKEHQKNESKSKKQTLKRLQTKTKKVDGRNEEKRERKTRENTRTQMPSKIGTQKKCAIFEKSNVVKGGSFDPSKTTALFCANLARLSKDFLLLIGELSLH